MTALTPREAPVWIRYCGLIPMTKRGYFITLAAEAIVAVAVVLVGWALGFLPPLRTMWEPDANVARAGGVLGWIYNHLYWIALVCLAGQAVDTVLVLRQFARKEAAAKAEGNQR